jgi:hypothetical protein
MQLKAMGLIGHIMSKTDARQNLESTLLPTKFELRNDVLSYDDMQINVDKYPLNFMGTIGPNVAVNYPDRKKDKKLDMRVTTPYIIASGLKPRTIKVGEITDKKRLSLSIGGTLHKPEFRFDVDELLEEVLKQGVEDILKKGLEDLFK